MITLATLTLCTTALAARPDKPVGNQAQFAGHRNGDQSWQWHWEKWLPDKYRRVFHCETPTNGQYINWQHDSGTYQGGPGFYYGSWDQFKPVSWWPDEAYDATPWQQYQTARAIVAQYGFTGWGCGGA